MRAVAHGNKENPPIREMDMREGGTHDNLWVNLERQSYSHPDPSAEWRPSLETTDLEKNVHLNSMSHPFISVSYLMLRLSH